MKSASTMHMTSATVTYISPLRDGACGTTPRSQQPICYLLRQELFQILRVMPALFWAMLIQRKPTSWADTATMMIQIVLACLEIGIMLTAIPLWLALPGAVFAVWAGICVCLVTVMCWMLNGKEQVHQCSAGSEGWTMGQETEDEKWMFLGGMGMSVIPAPATAMSRHFPRCHASSVDPFQARRNLYSHVRCALLDDSMNRCVVLSHNDSAVLLSQVVAQLHADLSSGKLRKLEIYTFGSAACEFMMPLGELDTESEPVHQSGDSRNERQRIHVEHFAMANDSFTRIGVLQSVRQNMGGRFCSDVFIMNSMPNSHKPNRRSMCSGLTMEEYLMALFPAHILGGCAAHRGILDSVMTIDRDCAEKGEIAAMSNYHAASQGKNGGKRLSWTGLAASAEHKQAPDAANSRRTS
ncbi:hypothetical protein VTK56DRAFT_3845 [Thermocarpiscus australiensis]